MSTAHREWRLRWTDADGHPCQTHHGGQHGARAAAKRILRIWGEVAINHPVWIACRDSRPALYIPARWCDLVDCIDQSDLRELTEWSTWVEPSPVVPLES